MPPENDRIKPDEGGKVAVKYAVEKYNLVRLDQTEGPFDAETQRGRDKYQIKGCVDRYSNGNRGRFRVWESDHVPGLDWYVFVVYDEDGNVLHSRRAKPATVSDLLDGRWTTASHALKPGRQAKITWTQVITQ